MWAPPLRGSSHGSSAASDRLRWGQFMASLGWQASLFDIRRYESDSAV
jgi:hypothetical protein